MKELWGAGFMCINAALVDALFVVIVKVAITVPNVQTADPAINQRLVSVVKNSVLAPRFGKPWKMVLHIKPVNPNKVNETTL